VSTGSAASAGSQPGMGKSEVNGWGFHARERLQAEAKIVNFENRRAAYFST